MGVILIAVGGTEDRATLRQALEPCDFLVRCADNIEDATAQARAARPDAVIWDASWPRSARESLRAELHRDAAIAPAPFLIWADLSQMESDGQSNGDGQHHADDFADIDPLPEWLPRDAPPETIRAKVQRVAEFERLAAATLLNERLARLGRLLAGIIHEIRSPLFTLKTHAELLRMDVGDESPLRARIDPIVRNAQLLQLRLEHLMASVRGGPGQHQAIDPGETAKEAFDLFRASVDSRIRAVLDFECAPDLPAIKADPGQVLQVLLNLLMNAQDAVLSGEDESPAGRIRLTARSETRDDREGIAFEVRNGGAAISEALLPRLFEPFFTTKAGGSGFGLYLAQALVHDHGGRIQADNPPGGGARFVVWLPAVSHG